VEKVLASLEEKIKAQIAMEYHSEAAQRDRFEKLTVPELLNMLAYMFAK